jgi:hypothetical protein
MVFFQASSPTGWTLDTTHNDKALRVVSGTGGGSGGTTGISSLDHNHQWHDYIDVDTVKTYDSNGTSTIDFATSSGVNANAIAINLGSGNSFRLDAYTKNSEIDPLYIDVIVCTKD